MLRPFTDLRNLSLGATDGEIGTIKDAYFDDDRWTLRYLVVATGTWLSGREVVITPNSIHGVNWSSKTVDVNLSRKQIEKAPSPEDDMPVSRQYETRLHDYYGYPYYWASPAWSGLAGAEPMAAAAAEAARQAEAKQAAQTERGDSHLRSAREVIGYQIQASDDSIGSVDDFLFDDTHWSLRFFVVDTRKWLPGRRVLIATDWITDVRWQEREVGVAMTREEVRSSPEFDASELNDSNEDALYRHYGRTRTNGPRVQIR
jgi:uncharacterized protein YrrD